MKTKDLIRKLQEIDPEGEMEVCVHNQDIHGSIYAEPAYWDGRLQRISKRDEHGWPIETTIETGGSKINLSPLDLSDKYTDTLIEDGEEYQILTNGGLPKGYNWLDADWTARKVDWLIWAEKYIEDDIKSHGFTKEPEKKLEFIRNLQEKYKNWMVDALREYAKKSFKRKQRTSAIKLIEKLTEKRPIVLDVFRHGKDYAAMTGASWRGHEFQTYDNGVVKYKRHRDSDYVEIDLNIFDFDVIVEEFDELQKKKYWQ